MFRFIGAIVVYGFAAYGAVAWWEDKVRRNAGTASE
jgi:hypothetical protein